MELEQLKTLLENPGDLYTKIVATKGQADGALIDLIKQYDPAEHKINDEEARPKKQVKTDTGTKMVDPVRLSIPMQKHIVALAAAFLCGNPIELSCSPSDTTQEGLLLVLKKVWEDNKLDYESKNLCKKMMAETECAELWYVEPADGDYWAGTPNEGKKYRLRMRILAPSLGDILYPVSDQYGDMIAFGRGYKVKDESGKETEHFDVYTSEFNYFYQKQQGQSDWLETKAKEPNQNKKIPVIYYQQEQVEWADVQSMIDRLEELISNLSDTNDYFGSPIVFVEGEVDGFASKGERGKVLKGKNGAKASYLTWDQSPESVKLEYNNLRSLIMDFSSTPDISIEQMKSLGTYSGVALKMLFLGAHLKAADKEETFGKAVQRRINYLKTILAKINPVLEKAVIMSIKPKFEYYLPKNLQEDVEIVSTAVTAGFMSRETAMKNVPELIPNPETELQKIKDEANAPSQLDTLNNGQ